ncbi:MAG: VirB3 family type IV secretion system protein [Sphingobacteriia bacterium]|nr:VirB3 family type IV secretion system protein [Sphingobacteriia bacterium]
MSDGNIETDPLFVGLTRPAMMLGVPYNYFAVNFFFALLLFINFDNKFKAIFGAVFMHFLGYILSFKEPRFMDLFMVKMKKCNRCKNKIFHGANSYDPF